MANLRGKGLMRLVLIEYLYNSPMLPQRYIVRHVYIIHPGFVLVHNIYISTLPPYCARHNFLMSLAKQISKLEVFLW
jgi:hypothetical protein